jgi:hypothetical protein
MDPIDSPFRRPPPRPAAFRPRRRGFGPVPAAPLTASARHPRAARRRSRGVPRAARIRALGQGAGAVYLVAALILVGAALALVSYEPGVIIGLGLTREGPAGGAALGLAAGFLLVGLLAQRGRLWPLAIGAAVYALDGLIVLAAHDWAAVAIHTVVRVMLVRGLDAGRRLA